MSMSIAQDFGTYMDYGPIHEQYINQAYAPEHAYILETRNHPRNHPLTMLN